MSKFVSFVWIFMELLCSLIFCQSLLPRKNLSAKQALSVIAGWLWLFLVTNCYSGPVPVIYITTATHILISFICFQGPWYRHFLAVVTSILLLSLLDTLIIYTMSVLMDVNMVALFSKKYTYLVTVTLSKGAALLAAWAFYLIWSKRGHGHPNPRWMLLTILFPFVSLGMLVVIFNAFQTDKDLSAPALLFAIAVTVGNIGILYLIHQLEQSAYEAQRHALLKQQMEIQTHSILALEKSYRAQRTASHEFSHHLEIIRSLLDKGAHETLSDYINTLQSAQSASVFSVNSHHPIIDAVLNQKYQTAKEYGIDIQVNVNDLSSLSLPADALVVLLSNLIDNATEACSAYPGEKILRISIILQNTLFIRIDNTTSPVSILDGKIESTKQNREEHGFGLQNATHILKDLNADYAFHYQNGWFSFAAEIPL